MNKILIYEREFQKWLSFTNPICVYKTERYDEVLGILDKIEEHVRRENVYAAGFMSFACASAFDSGMRVHSNQILPLVAFGIYREPLHIIDIETSFIYNKNLNFDFSWESKIKKEDYQAKIQEIKKYIQDGISYQINFTYPLLANLDSLSKEEIYSEAWKLFLYMLQAQKYHYGAWIEDNDWIIASASPELFFQTKKNNIIMKPMKGTSKRGLDFQSDIENAYDLQNSLKARAENAMIVDMVRNDLSRLAGSKNVIVKNLFTLEQFPSVWQLTSTVQTQASLHLKSIFSNIFPPASVTGAPKVSTVNLIHELEDESREVYTGSIGFWGPHSQSQFNVAIRTTLFDLNTKQAKYGVGGGVLWDSNSEDEWCESQVKAKILKKDFINFELFETLLWEWDKGFFLLEEHLNRLYESSQYFQFLCDVDEIRDKLLLLVKKLTLENKIYVAYKIKINLNVDGFIKITHQKWDMIQNLNYHVVLAVTKPVNSQNHFLYHKTTIRKAYDEAMSSYSSYNDVLLINERSEITESSIANFIIRLGGEDFTPPIKSGLLNGVHRQKLLLDGKLKEKVISIEDLKNCEDAYLVNSIRKIWKIHLHLPSQLNTSES